MSELPASRRTLRGVLWRWLTGTAALVTSLAFLVGVALRASGYDGDPRLLAVRYATPLPVLAALALAVFMLRWRRPGLLRNLALFCIAGCLAQWWSHSHRAHPPQHAPAELRVAYWNANRPPARAPQTAEFAASLGADILGLGETGATYGYIPRGWRERFADRSIVPMRGGMMLITRGRAELLESGPLRESGIYSVVAVEIDGLAWKVILVDLFAHPWYPRQPAFDMIRELAVRHAGPRLIVMGDFNTPADAPATSALREKLHDAFETAGRGWAETWPMPAPVLSLDHIWLSRETRVLRCEHGWSWLSDHRPVIATVAVE